MPKTHLDYLDQAPALPTRYRTGVSLHSHTLHSKESVAIIGRIAGRVRLLQWIIQSQYRRHGGRRSLPEDLKRWWWTSPLSATQALDIERRQIEEKLGLPAFVSISDHDNMEAPLQLQLIEKNAEVPVSVEWTTPYHETYFHLGVHNIDPQAAKPMMERMEAYTRAPALAVLREMLHELHETPDVLIVFNHPMWDQPWIGRKPHVARMKQFLEEFGPYLHALEINGLRSWRENREVIDLARATGMLLISGGDRHGREPNATLNLTNASTFPEFVEEVRAGHSHVLVMPQYREPLKQRIIQSSWDIVREDKDHSMGWTHLADRVFRLCESGEIKSMSDVLDGKHPFWVRQFIFVMRLLANPRLRPALQWALEPQKELAL